MYCGILPHAGRHHFPPEVLYFPSSLIQRPWSEALYVIFLLRTSNPLCLLLLFLFHPVHDGCLWCMYLTNVRSIRIILGETRELAGLLMVIHKQVALLTYLKIITI